MSIENFRIRPLQKNDLSLVQRIEQQSYPHPWTNEQFLQELENPVAAIDLLWVDERLAGYICYWLIAAEMEVLNVATSPEFRRFGVAGKLLNHSFSVCLEKGLKRAFLEVRSGNMNAIALYQRHGFVAAGVRKGYYRDGEDALLMVCDFTESQ